MRKICLLVYDYAICREQDGDMSVCSVALFKKTKRKETTSANTVLHASCSHALNLEKQKSHPVWTR